MLINHHGATARGLAMPSAFPASMSRRLVVVCDVSGSMEEASLRPGISKLALTTQALLAMLSDMGENRPNDDVAIVAYSNSGHLCCGFLSVRTDHHRLVQAVHMLDCLAHEGTFMAEGLQLALDLFGNRHVDAPRLFLHVVAYSDGHDHAPDSAISLASALRAAGCLVETFGMGRAPHEVNEGLLRQVATTDSDGINHYRFIGDAEDLQKAFRNIAKGSLIVED